MASASLRAADIPTLAWTPRSDWLDVTKPPYNADKTGASPADAAINLALSNATSGKTIYFPPGTYRITQTLNMKTGRPTGVTLVGHGASTVLAWYGSAGGTLLSDPSTPHSLFIGLKLDGRNIAAVGFDENNTSFNTEVRWRHMAFMNFTAAGVQANPAAVSPVAEASFNNCLFSGCGTGIKITKYNDYDFTISGSDFISCGTGIDCRRGNVYIRDCYFEGSATADILTAGPEHGCSVRRCVSEGSEQFITSDAGVSPLQVQDCHVSGWTSGNGAISHGGAPLVLHNNSFVNPPDANAPVRFKFGSPKVILCNNAAPQSTALLASGASVYTVPAGVNGRNIGEHGHSIFSFVNQDVSVPTVVFDAKAYGAIGNGTADDTTAIQQTIDAARIYGRGALAYIPTGNYKITSTLTITGSDYVVGGSGYNTRLFWRGADGGTTVSVSNPHNIRLENIMVGHADIDPNGTNAYDIRQTGAGPSSMAYEGVWVFGCYKRQPETRGLMLDGLGSNNVVTLDCQQGNLRVKNSARATILGSITYEGAIVVDDSTSAVRDGFLGFMTRLSTLNDESLLVRNNNSLVMSDFYTEQGARGPTLSGVAGNPSGRVTISGPKVQYTPSAGASATFLTLNDYQGDVAIVGSQFYILPTYFPIVTTGTRVADLIFAGDSFYNSALSFPGSAYVTLHAFGNAAAGSMAPPADNYDSGTLGKMSTAFDDLQKLGNLDLALNFSHVGGGLRFGFNEGAGNVTFDLSGAGNTGYLVNSPIWTTGVRGSALKFDGINAFTYSPTVVGIPAANEVQTVAWWQRMTPTPNPEMVAVCLRNASTGVSFGYRAGQFGAWKHENGAWLVSATSPGVGHWHHCAYTFDGTTHRLYADGIQVAASTTSPSTSVPTVVHVAARGGWAGASNFAGDLDDIRIYQRPMTALEIQLLANTSNATFQPIFQADFNGAGGGTGGPGDVVSIGGAGTLGASAGSTYSITGMPIMGQGNFLNMVTAAAPNTSQKTVATFSPAPGASWNTLTSSLKPGAVSYTAFNGAFDVFVRPNSSANGDQLWFRPVDIDVRSGNTGLRMILNGVGNSLVFQLVSNSTSAFGADGSTWNASTELMTPAFTFTPGAVNHVAVTFQTNPATGQVTVKLFAVGSGAAIDTTSSTNLCGTLTFYANSSIIGPNVLGSGSWTMLSRSLVNWVTTNVDYDKVRIYNADPLLLPSITGN